MNVSFSARPPDPNRRPGAIAGVSAVLGPTNTGKTHYAIERMLAHRSGMIGLPLRLLAREVYNRVVEKVGVESVALITGEEKIKPKEARYFVSTVEAMPRDLNLDFAAVDEVQLAGDFARGHVFTDRLLNLRGRVETLLIGAETIEHAMLDLLPGVRVQSRPRLSKLSFAGDRKMTRLPRRSAIVAFSAEDVYAIAEWIRRLRGGAAVVLGALSPRTRNAQVEMFQAGDVDYLVATDAIGMGLNLDVEHIAFAADRKFDGWQHRRLTPAEFSQIAGRAGRHMRDGTFGTTGRCPPFEAELVEALEDHRFEAMRILQWRNSALDFSSIQDLAASLDALPNQAGLVRAPLAEDQMVLEIAARDEKVIRETKTSADIARLWDCCQIPDYRKLSPAAHAELVLSIYGFVVRAGHIPADWFARHIGALDRVDGDLDALSARIAQVRTWTFIANRSGWLRDAAHWQGIARQVEDTLSDALHARLAQRFVDRRASVLMRRLRENAMLEAEVTTSGDVMVEGQHVGQLNGFRFTADLTAVGEAAKALNAAAQKALAAEIEGRAARVHEAVDESFVLASDGVIRWLGEPIAKIAAGAHVLQPTARVLADDRLAGPALESVQRRLDLWLAQHVKKLLGPLIDLEQGEGLEGLARGIAFQVAESLGVLERAKVADDVKSLPQEGRAALRKFGIRFAAYHLYLPNLLKPAPRALAAQLWALKNSGLEEVKGLDSVPHLAASGRTSFVVDKDVPKGFYRAAGFRVCGERAVRVDILERLADLIRPAVAYRPGVTPGDPPAGAADGDGFVVTVAMTSLAGCAGDNFASILRSLGYGMERRPGPPIATPLLPKAATEPLATHTPDEQSSDGTDADAPLGAAQSEPATENPPDFDASRDVAGSEPTPERLVHQDEGEAIGAASDGTPDNLTTSIPPEEPAPAPALADDAGVPAAAPACDAAAIEAPAAEDPGEAEQPVLIEVWRPVRQQHQGRRPEARPGKRFEPRERAGFSAPADAAASGEAADGAAAHRPGRRRARPNRTGRDQNAEIPPQNGVSDAAMPAHASAEQTVKRESRGGQPPRGKSGPRYDSRRDRREDSAHSRTAEPGRRGRGGADAPAEKKSFERPPDPNSPFAKLLALKATLEEKHKPDR